MTFSVKIGSYRFNLVRSSQVQVGIKPKSCFLISFLNR